MPKNIHTYKDKLNALWTQMRHTVDYLVKCNGIDWVVDNCSEVIEVGHDSGVHFSGTADDVATAVDALVLKAQREAHGCPTYAI